jgi:hypothetical protein
MTVGIMVSAKLHFQAVSVGCPIPVARAGNHSVVHQPGKAVLAHEVMPAANPILQAE